jgi:hypothetical protein
MHTHSFENLVYTKAALKPNEILFNTNNFVAHIPSAALGIHSASRDPLH